MQLACLLAVIELYLHASWVGWAMKKQSRDYPRQGDAVEAEASLACYVEQVWLCLCAW